MVEKGQKLLTKKYPKKFKANSVVEYRRIKSFGYYKHLPTVNAQNCISFISDRNKRYDGEILFHPLINKKIFIDGITWFAELHHLTP